MSLPLFTLAVRARWRTLVALMAATAVLAVIAGPRLPGLSVAVRSALGIDSPRGAGPLLPAAAAFLAGTLLGALLGAATVWVRELTDRRVRSAEQLEALAAGPVLGIIPRRRAAGDEGLWLPAPRAPAPMPPRWR